MTIFYVDALNGADSNDGGAGAPFRTTAAALAAVRPGDTVRLRGRRDEPDTYYRRGFTVNVADTTWEADDGHSPTWDGDYNRDGDSYELGNARPGGLYAKMIVVRARGVTLRGLRCQHIGGGAFGVGVGADDCLIENCESDTTYGGSLDVGGPDKKSKIKNVTIRDCRFFRSSLAWHAQGMRSANAVMFKFADNVTLVDSVVAYSMKEGINADKECDGILIEGCTIHSINHSGVYVNRARNVTVRGNVIYHTKGRGYLGAAYKKRTAPTAIKLGDEGKPGSKPAQYANSFNQVVEGNTVIGGSSCLTVANNPNNYDTQLNGASIRRNTFIGEVWTDADGISRSAAVVEIFANLNGRPHRDSVFEENIIYAPRGVALGRISGAGGVTFQNNAWYSADGDAPPVNGAGDVTADPRLANPIAVVGETFALDNYRPEPGSPVAMWGALAPSGDEPPPPPPPPPPDPEPEPEPGPDVAAIVAALEVHKGKLAMAGLAIGDALIGVDELIALLTE